MTQFSASPWATLIESWPRLTIVCSGPCRESTSNNRAKLAPLQETSRTLPWPKLLCRAGGNVCLGWGLGPAAPIGAIGPVAPAVPAHMHRLPKELRKSWDFRNDVAPRTRRNRFDGHLFGSFRRRFVFQAHCLYPVGTPTFSCGERIWTRKMR